MSLNLNFLKLRNFVNQESVYMLMLSFILLVNAFAIMAEKIPEFKTGLKEERILESEELQQERENKLEYSVLKDEETLLKKLREGDSRLRVLLNVLGLGIIIAFSFGLFLDIRILMAKIRKREVLKAESAHQVAIWGIRDIARLAIIFVFLGYTLHIIETLLLSGFKKETHYAFFPILNTGIMDLTLLGFVIYFVKVKYNQNLAAMGLKVEGWAKNVFLAAISYIAFLPILFFILLLVILVAMLFNYQPPQQLVFKLFFEEHKLWFLVFSTLLVVILGPIVEEVFFRGFAYGALKKRWGKQFAMILTAAVFAGLHTNLFGFLPIMALGYLLVYMYEKTGSLIPSIAIHILHNGAMVALLFLGRYFIYMLESA